MIRACITILVVLLSSRCLILFMACSVLKSWPDNLFICVVVVMVLLQYMPRFRAASVGLILSFPIFYCHFW